MVVTLDIEGSIKFFFELGNKRPHAAKFQRTLVHITKCCFTPKVNPANDNRFTTELGIQKVNHRICLYTYFSVDEIFYCCVII